jgi:hypothetical protein
MEPVILLIRRSGHQDIVESFGHEDEARAALTRFVREQPSIADNELPQADAQAVATWFAAERAFYAITRLAPDAG